MQRPIHTLTIKQSLNLQIQYKMYADTNNSAITDLLQFIEHIEICTNNHSQTLYFVNLV